MQAKPPSTAALGRRRQQVPLDGGHHSNRAVLDNIALRVASTGQTVRTRVHVNNDGDPPRRPDWGRIMLVSHGFRLWIATYAKYPDGRMGQPFRHIASAPELWFEKPGKSPL